ncbi:MAG: hypothetical protein GX684_03910 [Ruminococcaceae bacterium]|nr:hypothetical protein [Oscillospiraceae bacterium]
MSYFAVIDTETTWNNELMSIGVVIAETCSFLAADMRYYVLTPFKDHGGMYSDALYIDGITPYLETGRKNAVSDLIRFLDSYGISTILAYNAGFDKGHLPELGRFIWRDIMALAAYRQHNPHIPDCADCYSTGRLKRGYGVESIYRMISSDFEYYELHNALTDAVDELRILKILGHDIGKYRLC